MNDKQYVEPGYPTAAIQQIVDYVMLQYELHDKGNYSTSDTMNEAYAKVRGKAEHVINAMFANVNLMARLGVDELSVCPYCQEVALRDKTAKVNTDDSLRLTLALDNRKEKSPPFKVGDLIITTSAWTHAGARIGAKGEIMGIWLEKTNPYITIRINDLYFDIDPRRNLIELYNALPLMHVPSEDPDLSGVY